jgi:hypothetical protein
MTRIAIRAQRRRLLNEAMDAYIEWREQCRAVRVAYSSWAGAPASDAEVWYATYAAALDREERASELYARLAGRVGDLVPTDLEPTSGLAWTGRDR